MTACKAIIFKLTEQKIYYARSLGEFVEFYLFIYGCSRAHTTINCATALPLAWHRAARSKQGPANDPLDAFQLLPTLLQFILFFFCCLCNYSYPRLLFGRKVQQLQWFD